MPPHLTNPQLLERIRQCPSLPTMPAIALNLIEAAEDPDADVAAIAKLISKDPALSSKLLRTVNSSFYGCSYNISTISHALVLLGLQSVKTLILGFSLVQALTKNRPAGFDHLLYWRRSVYAATAARLISARIGIVQQEEAFLATLLNDIGMLVLDQVLGKPYGEACANVRRHTDLARVEAEQIGITHAEAGGILAEHWKLPPLLSVPIAFHHRPDEVEDQTLQQIARLVELSGWCADVFVEEHAADPIARVRQNMARHFHLSSDAADELLSEVGRKTREVASLFEIRISASTEYEAILKKASDALLAMTLQSQPVPPTAGSEGAGAAPPAAPAEAGAAPAAAPADPAASLAPLAPRPALQQMLAEAFAANPRKTLSLLLVQLDHLPAIRNSDGPDAAEQVVNRIGKLLGVATKPAGLAARWDADRLALLLIGSTRQATGTIAETLRRAIAARPIPVADGSRAVSMSATIGVAIAETDGPLSGPAHLIKASEMTLDAAAKAGHNCVRILCPKPANAPAAA